MMLQHENLELQLISTPHQFQIIHFVIAGNGVVEPRSLHGLRLPPLDFRLGVVLSGKGPVWLFAYLAHLCHPAAWVAIFDPRLGAVVVQNHVATGPATGTCIPLEHILPYLNAGMSPPPTGATTQSEHRSAVIAVVGPAHSGKSVFLYALQRHLHRRMGTDAFQREVFVLRGAPDGEGNWFHEIPADVARLIRHKGSFDDAFVEQMLEAIRHVRASKKLVLVDCGGKIDRRNQRIWNECSHALLVSKEAAQLPEWRGAVQASGVDVLAEIISTKIPSQEILSPDPLLVKLGPLERHEQSPNLPDALVESVLTASSITKNHQ